MADLDTLLATAPAGSKDASQKQAHADQVFQALDKIADSKIDVTIDAMSPDAGDVLLKYVYKGLERRRTARRLCLDGRPSTVARSAWVHSLGPLGPKDCVPRLRRTSPTARRPIAADEFKAPPPNGYRHPQGASSPAARTNRGA